MYTIKPISLKQYEIRVSDPSTASLHKLAAAHLQAPERQIGYCTPMKTVVYNKFNNNTWFQSVGSCE